MPLDKSGSKASIGKNIRELMSTGKYPQRQVIAIAESVKRRAGGTDHNARLKRIMGK